MRIAAVLFVLAAFVSAGWAQQRVQPQGALARMPVKEITIFKDGHAFVVHEGTLPTDEAGNVRMDYVPIPVLGTFWPYSNDKNVKLTAVTASPRRLRIDRTALTLQELVEANTGVVIDIAKNDGSGYRGMEILGIPERTSEELEATSVPGSGEQLGQKGQVVLLKSTEEGILTLPLNQIKHVSFKGAIKRTVSQEEFRNLLTLHLNWPGGRKAAAAPVGMAYLQKGIRWIPGYRLDIDGKGSAAVKLQATFLNEMVDLNNVTANLVIGVPTFSFKETPDPVSLQQTLSQLSPYFQTDARTGYALSNAMMGQMARAGDYGGVGGGGRPAAAPGPGPEVTEGEKAEDLFVFTVKNVSLKRGERMVMPVADYALKYKDVFTLDIPIAPPPDIRANINSEQQAELAKLMAEPKVIHKIRLTNNSKQPLTTAPALIIKGEQVLGQGLMTYTARGSESDLTITTAPDVKVKKSEKETSRVPNSVEFQGNRYTKVEMSGTLSLTNYRDTPVDLEITRYVYGQVDKADHGAKVEMVNMLEDTSGGAPTWWSWYNWPYWWRQFNGLGKFTWKLRLEPGKSIDLVYSWRYFSQ